MSLCILASSGNSIFCSAIECLVVDQILFTVRMKNVSVILHPYECVIYDGGGGVGFTVTSFYFLLFAARLVCSRNLVFLLCPIYCTYIFVFCGHSGNLWLKLLLKCRKQFLNHLNRQAY